MPRLVRVLKNRNFSLLWTGHTLSHLGDNIFRVALVWLIVTETNSAQATALVFMAFFYSQYSGVFVCRRHGGPVFAQRGDPCVGRREGADNRSLGRFGAPW